MSFLYSWFYPPNEAPVQVAPTPLELKQALEKLSKIPIEKNRKKYLTPLAQEFQSRVDSGRYHKWDSDLSLSSSIAYRLLQEKAENEAGDLPALIEHYKVNASVLRELQNKL